ncbi:protocadherin 2 alpha a 15, partial [Silurus meridionalis]
GLAPMISDKTVTIKIVDVNDNAPEIEVTSFSSVIPEDSKSGTTVALISVSDLDSGVNGKVSCSVPEDMPFKLLSSPHNNVYSLVTSSTLDREMTAHYDITLSAKDEGNPPLSSLKTVTVHVSDVNDNSPEFIGSPYTFYVMENNAHGTSLFSLFAFDRDSDENALISYQIWKDNLKENKYASFINVNSENGAIYALKTFDFETIKTFQFHV